MRTSKKAEVSQESLLHEGWGLLQGDDSPRVHIPQTLGNLFVHHTEEWVQEHEGVEQHHKGREYWAVRRLCIYHLEACRANQRRWVRWERELPSEWTSTHLVRLLAELKIRQRIIKEEHEVSIPGTSVAAQCRGSQESPAAETQKHDFFISSALAFRFKFQVYVRRTKIAQLDSKSTGP